MASRKDDIQKMSSFIGNAAAHRAIYGEHAFTFMEAKRYEGLAEEVAKLRTYNPEEIARLIERSKREARNIIKKRKQGEQAKVLKGFYATAEAEIETFIAKAVKPKGKKKEV